MKLNILEKICFIQFREKEYRNNSCHRVIYNKGEISFDPKTLNLQSKCPKNTQNKCLRRGQRSWSYVIFKLFIKLF